MGAHISNIDIAIIIIYFVIVLGIGLVIAMRTRTSDELFLGGRTFTWGLIGVSLFASNISTTTIMGLSGAAYKTGIVTSVYEWMSGIPLIIAAIIFVPLYLKSKITTIPEFLEKRFDRRSQIFFSLCTIFATILVEMAGGLYAGGLVLQVFFPDVQIWQAAFTIAIIAGLYTAFGGLKAVVYTDAIQAVILVVGCSVLTYMLFDKLDFDWDKVLSSTPEHHFSVVRPLSDPTLPWPGILLGVQLLGFWYWSTNQYIVQRVLGARDIKHARWGVIFAGFLKILPLFIMVIPGAMAIVLYPGIENGDSVFPTLVTEVLPVGMVGLVLAGLVAAIMSSVDSSLNSASTLVVIDFVKPNRPNLTEHQLKRYGSITTLILMVIAASWAPMLERFDGIWDYLQQMYSIFVPPVVVLFLVGVFYKRGNGQGAIWTLGIGTLIGILFFTLTRLGFWHLHFTITVGIVIAICTLVFILVSNATDPPDREVINELTFSRDLVTMGTEGLPWYKNYLYQIVLLTAIIFMILIVLW